MGDDLLRPGLKAPLPAEPQADQEAIAEKLSAAGSDLTGIHEQQMLADVTKEDEAKGPVDFDQAAARAEDHAQKGPYITANEPYTLANGIVVKVRSLPPGLATRMYARMRADQPRIPKLELTDEATGKPYKVDDPDDETYQDALERYNFETGMQMREVILAFVDVVKLPDGIMKEDDDAWMLALEIAGEPLPETPAGRKMAWMDCVVVSTAADWLAIQACAMRETNIPEAAVQEAMEGFRGKGGRD